MFTRLRLLKVKPPRTPEAYAASVFYKCGLLSSENLLS